MKQILTICLLSFCLTTSEATLAQCSICTKTAQQLGHKPAEGMNSGIIYLMIAPLAIIGFVSARWWKGNMSNKSSNKS